MKYWLVFYNGFNLNSGGNDNEEDRIYSSELVRCPTKQAAIRYVAGRMEVSTRLFEAVEMELHDLSDN